LAPQYIDLIDTRGVVYYRLGELDKAVQDFTRCIGLYQETAPSCTATHFHLGRALERLGQKARAVENLKKAIELNGENGGLSTVEVDETQRLIEKLSEGA
jgi:tetratricopeptide (TPR) repeat protein